MGNLLYVTGQSQVYVFIVNYISTFFPERFNLKLNTVNFKGKFRGPVRILLLFAVVSPRAGGCPPLVYTTKFFEGPQILTLDTR